MNGICQMASCKTFSVYVLLKDIAFILNTFSILEMC